MFFICNLKNTSPTLPVPSALSHINWILYFLDNFYFHHSKKNMLLNAEEKHTCCTQHMHKVNKELLCHQQNKHHMQRKTNPYLMFQVPVFWNISKNWHYCQPQTVHFLYSNLSLCCVALQKALLCSFATWYLEPPRAVPSPVVQTLLPRSAPRPPVLPS